MKDPYSSWLSQASESERTTKRYLQDIKHFATWAQANRRLIAANLPTGWRQAKYLGEAEKERFLDELKDVLGEYFAYLKQSQYSHLSINRNMSVVMSFLHYFDMPIKPIRIRHPYVIYHNRDITKEEIRRIVGHSDVRNRAMFLLLYESGIRPDTLVNLRWRHIKDDFLNRRIPMKIVLTSDILKCRVRDRWSFIGDEGFEALKKYLDLRLPLKDDDLIFSAEKGKPRGAKLEPGAVSQAFNKMVQKLRLAERRGTKPKDLRLYCLRKAFRKLMASDVDQSYVEFWMGHTTTATHYLSSDVEHHRGIYAKGYPSLQIHESPSDTRSRIEEQQKEIENLKKQLAEQQAALGILRDLLTSDEKVIERVRLKMTGVSTGSDSDRQPQA